MDIEKIISELTLEEKASLCSGGDFWHTKAVERMGIPAVMVCDGPNGLRKQESGGDHLGIKESVRAVCFPAAAALASSFDRELLGRLGEVLGNECQAEGVGMLLGPGMNIKRSPLCGRNFEYYSEDPYQSSQMASAYIQGLQGKGVGSCVKHFAANNQETRRQSGDSVVDERTLHEIYLSGFEEVVKAASPWGVMCSYNRVNGTFAAENRFLLTEILRDCWGYDGMVVTDWGAVKDRVKGIDAGLDLEMPGGSGAEINDRKIVKAVESGELSMEVLDGTVRRVLRFVDKAVSRREPGACFDREQDYRVGVEMAKECAVLLKNEGGVLPLQKNGKAAFIGGFVETPRIQGAGSSHVNSAKTPRIFDRIREQESICYAKGFDITSEETDKDLLEEAVKLARQSDVAVIFAGLPERMEAEGEDRICLSLPANQNKLISEICAVQPRTVVVLHNGAPVEMPWVGDVAAILEMYLCGDGSSEAAIALLFGEANPCGKLAETFPLRLQDTPCYLDFPGEKGRTEYREGVFVGYRWYDKREMPVLFPFGHGLSYTSFAYSGLTLSRERIRDSEQVRISVTVENTGGRAGKEVVQLYVGQIGSTVRRPVRELKGFEKVALEPGEKKEIHFVLDKEKFAYYEPAIHDWYAETGSYEVSVGASSRDIRQKAQVQLEASSTLPIKVGPETSISDLLQFPAAAEIFWQLFGDVVGSAEADNAGASLGEGAVSLAVNALDMPVGALLSFGVLDQEGLDRLLEAAQA